MITSRTKTYSAKGLQKENRVSFRKRQKTIKTHQIRPQRLATQSNSPNFHRLRRKLVTLARLEIECREALLLIQEAIHYLLEHISISEALNSGVKIDLNSLRDEAKKILDSDDKNLRNFFSQNLEVLIDRGFTDVPENSGFAGSFELIIAILAKYFQTKEKNPNNPEEKRRQNIISHLPRSIWILPHMVQFLDKIERAIKMDWIYTASQGHIDTIVFNLRSILTEEEGTLFYQERPNQPILSTEQILETFTDRVLTLLSTLINWQERMA